MEPTNNRMESTMMMRFHNIHPKINGRFKKVIRNTNNTSTTSVKKLVHLNVAKHILSVHSC